MVSQDDHLSAVNLWDTAALVHSAWSVARDNRTRGGGVQAYLMLRAAAMARADQSEIGQLAESLGRHQTFFRDLLPGHQPQGLRPYSGVFHRSRLRDPQAPPATIVLSSGTVEDTASQLTHARFVQVSADELDPSLYELPRKLGTSTLRIHVDRSHLVGTAHVFVQFDDSLPHDLIVEGETCVPNREFEPSRALAAVVMQQRMHDDQWLGMPTLSGPFSTRQQPARFVQAGSVELIVPAGVQRVKVWGWSDRGAPGVALQYRTSRTDALTETHFLALAERLGPSALHQLIAADQRPEDSLAAQALSNHLAPLTRLLDLHRQTLVRSVAERPGVSPPRQAASNLQEIQRAAELLVEQGQFVAAVEAWSEVAEKTVDPTWQDQAGAARSEALYRAGEHFLAERRNTRPLPLWQHTRDAPASMASAAGVAATATGLDRL